MPNELHYACRYGKLENVQILVKDNPSLVNQFDMEYEIYPIYWAAQSGHLEIIQFLLDKGAKTSDPQSLGFNLLLWACRCADAKKRQEILEYIYLNFDKFKFADGTSQLHVAAALGNIDQCTKQITELSVPNAVGVTPFYYSLLMRQGGIIELINLSINDSEKYLANYFDVRKIDNYFRYIFFLYVASLANNYEFAVHYSLLLINRLEKIIQEKSTDGVGSLANDNRNLSKCCKRFGDIFLKKEKYKDALQTYTHSITAIERIQDKTEFDIETLYFLRGCMTYVHSKLLMKKEKYSEAVGMLKTVIAETEKFQEQKNDDILDCYYVQLSDCHTGLGNTLRKNGEYVEALNAFKEALTACEKIKKDKYSEAVSLFKNEIAVTEQFKEQKKDDILDACYRKLSECYNLLGLSFRKQGKPIEAVIAFKDAIAACKRIIDKGTYFDVDCFSDDDADLDRYYFNLSDACNSVGNTLFKEAKYSEAVNVFKDAIEACEKIKVKTDNHKSCLNQYYINLSTVYNSKGVQLYRNSDYRGAIIEQKNATAVCEYIKLGTDDIIRHLDICHRNLLIYCSDFGFRLCNVENKYSEALNVYKDAIEASGKIQSKQDDDYFRTCKNYVNIATLCISLNVLPESVNLVEYYQKAVQEAFCIKIYTDRIYEAIARIYANWRDYYPKMFYGWHIAEFGQVLFICLNENVIDFNTKFLPIYNMVKNNLYLPEMLKLIPVMIQFMELLLRCSENHDKNSRGPYGVQYILNSTENKKSFEAKLNELRTILQSLSSLKNLLEHNPSVQIALLNKFNEIEKSLAVVQAENASLQRANEVLKRRLDQLESTSVKSDTQPAENKGAISADVNMRDVTPLLLFPAAPTSSHAQSPQPIHLARRNSPARIVSDITGVKRLIDDEGNAIASKVPAVELPEETSQLHDDKQPEQNYEKQMR